MQHPGQEAPTPPRPFWTRRDWLAFFTTFLVALGVYVFSLPPSVTMEDAGEFAVAADWLGVPHPPGYPIWTLTAWVFTRLFGWLSFRGHPNPAWALSFYSAFFGALACGLTAMLLCRVLRDLAATLHPGPCRPWQQRRHWLQGVGLGLLICLLLHTRTPAGRALLIFSGLFALVLAMLRGLSPEIPANSWRKSLPPPRQLGTGFLGVLAAGTAYFLAWSRVLVPSPWRVFPVALGFLLAAALLFVLCDLLLGLVARTPNLPEHVRRSALDLLCGVAGGLLLAFTPLMWSQSVIIEVYSLNAFFIALILWLAYAYLHQPHDRLLYTAAFVFALGLTNHQALLFLIVFLIAVLAASGRKHILKAGLGILALGLTAFFVYKTRQYSAINDADAQAFFLRLSILSGAMSLLIFLTPGPLWSGVRSMLMVILLGAAGLSLHLYLPIASEQNPPMNWGYARTPEGFTRLLTRGQYESFDVADNFRAIANDFASVPSPELLDPGREGALLRHFQNRTLLYRQLGSFFLDPAWKTSIASQFSWQFDRQTREEASLLDPPGPQRTLPLALLGLLPLLCHARFHDRNRAWIHCMTTGMFFLTVVFLIIQWPELNRTDLFVKRVQYVQAHVFYAVWMGMGAFLLTLFAYALHPKAATLRMGGWLMLVLFVVFPLHKDARDHAHITAVGSSNLRHHDFGWRFGNHILRGANGILLDELSHHRNPNAQLTPWAIDYLQTRGLPSEAIARIQADLGTDPMPQSVFTRQLRRSGEPLSRAQRRLVLDAALLGAFRALPESEQAAALIWMHRPLPDIDYPPEMDTDAIFFGGTDPGRFVPTYMVYSAGIRPDLHILTQNALADNTYLDSLRDLYGDRIFIPDAIDSTHAFRSYANRLRVLDPTLFGYLMGQEGFMTVTGVEQVNHINFSLTQRIAERNAHRHSVYVEESYEMPWMAPYLRPHGLILKLESEPVSLTEADRQRDREFWDWYAESLLETHRPLESRSKRYQRDPMARMLFSKLRGAIAGVYEEQGHADAAESAYLQAKNLWPASPETNDRLARMYQRQLRLDDAAAIVADYAQHDPANPWLQHFYRRLDQVRAANENRRATERVWEAAPSPEVALQLVHNYGQLKLTHLMEEAAEIVLMMAPENEEFYPTLAALMREQEHLELYESTLLHWATRFPENFRPLIELAVVAAGQQEYELMFDHMDEAIRRDPFAARNRFADDIRFADIRHFPRFQARIR